MKETKPGVPVRRVSVLGQTRSRQTRRNLVRAAIRLWEREDFDNITVDDIVAAAEVSKGTFYYYFARKEDLLVELGWETVDRVGEEAERAYEDGAGLEQALDLGLAGLARRVSGMPPGAVARTIQEFVLATPLRPTPRNSTRGGFLSGVLIAAQQRGDIPAGVDVDEVGDILTIVLVRAIVESVGGTVHEQLQKLLERRTRLVLYGALSPPAPAGIAKRRGQTDQERQRGR
jgi:AcrR family transcriptional regulator